MNKPNILLVGEHPFSFSGNGHMIYTLASLINKDKYNVRVFAGLKPDMIPDHFGKVPFDVIEGIDHKAKFCGEHLCQILSTNPIDIVVFVGLDCWAYHQVFGTLKALHKERKFVWCSIFPFDLPIVRNDWLDYIEPVDIPCVYSEYGLEKLQPHIPKIQYFRPPLYEVDTFTCLDKRHKLEERRKMFPSVADDVFIFGFIGNNQWRKDPLRAIRAFFNVKKTIPNSVMYVHMEYKRGVFNIPTYILDCDGKPGDVFLKSEGTRYPNLSLVYNALDCLVNTSLQEGLSWTILEAMLCGCPIIAADNTSQTELIKDGAALTVPCTDLAYVPSITPSGQSYLETRACNLEALEQAMISMATNAELREEFRQRGIERGKEWLSKTSDINVLIEEAIKLKTTTSTVTTRKKGILFAQHSSAGDVLMTTQCFKGIKETHKGRPLIYMTQKIYQDIVTNNPYIDQIIDWDETQLQKYESVYNPHGERILKGRFNRLDVTLHSMYPYFCKVKPDYLYIDLVDPHIDLPSIYALIHTTGGDPFYRTYGHMEFIVQRLGIPCIQIGGSIDKVCRGTFMDLRGKLTFRETAFVMKKAKVAVVIDSFPAHLAGALNTPVVTLFGPAPARVTRPRAEEGKAINLEPNWLDVCPDLGGCWGNSIQNACQSPCINSISPMIVLKAAQELLKKGEKA